MKDDDEVNELTSMDVASLRAVDRAANGTSFILLKAADPEDDEVAKAVLSTAGQNDLPDTAFAFIEPGGKKDPEGKTTPRSKRHFPIHDKAHVRNALAQAPQSPFGDKAMPKIKAAAERLGVQVGDEVAKAAGDKVNCLTCGGDGKIRGDKVSCPDCDGTGKVTKEAAAKLSKAAGDPGDPETPGSASWETEDQGNADELAATLAQAAADAADLRDRERTEVAVGAEDDYSDVWDLGEAVEAIGAALGIIAAFAYGEGQESKDAKMAEADMAKAAALRPTAAALHQTLRTAHEDLAGLLAKAQDPTPPNGQLSQEVNDMNIEEFNELTKAAHADLLADVKTLLDERLAAFTATTAGDELTKAETAPAVETPAPAASGEAAGPAPAEDLVKSSADVIAEAVAAALAPVGELVKTLGEKVDAFGGMPRQGGPALSELAGQAIRRGAPAQSDAEDLVKAFQTETDPYRVQELGKKLTMERIKRTVPGVPGIFDGPKA